MSQMTNVQWVDVVNRLREEHRLKTGTDFATLTKYGKTSVMCFEVYKPTIQAMLAEYGITVDQWFFIS